MPEHFGNGNIQFCPILKFHEHIGRWAKQVKGKSDICICMADSLCYKAETSTPL